MPPVEEEAAWTEPGTRRSYAAYRMGALRWFAGGLACLALAIGLSTYAVLVLEGPGLGVFIVAAAILGVIGVTAGIGGLLRAQRFRRTLQRAPWQLAELRVAGSHLRLVFAVPMDAGAGAGDGGDARSVDVRLITTSRWRVREVVGHRDGEVVVCPDGKGSYVLTAQGMNNLYGLQPLGRKVGHQRS